MILSGRLFLLASTIAVILLSWQQWQGSLWVDRVELTPETTDGLGAKARLARKLVARLPRVDESWVEENGRRLPLRAFSSQRVREEGHGRYHVRGATVWLSSTDDTTPSTNGRVYMLAVPHRVPAIGWIAGLAALAAGLVLCRSDCWCVLRWLWGSAPQPQAPGCDSGTSISPGEAMTPAPRNQGLDLLRGIAVLLVFFHHKIIAPEKAGWFAFPAKFLMDIGWIGVDLFFVLSGYLIGGLLFREAQIHGEIHVGRFLLRRAFKIGPSYLALIAATFVLVLAGSGWSLGAGTNDFLRLYWPNLLQWQNYRMTPLAHTWTLAVEEHFYLLLPLMVVFCPRLRAIRGVPAAWRSHPFLIAAVAGLAMCNVFRLTQLLQPQTEQLFDRVYHETQFRFDSLLFGCVLSYLRCNIPVAWNWVAARRRLVLAGAILAAIAIEPIQASGSLLYAIGYPLLYVSFGGLVVVMDHAGQRGLLARRQPPKLIWAMIQLGLLSYNFYLWHNHQLIRNRLIVFFQHAGTWSHGLYFESGLWLASNCVFLTITCAVAWLATRLIEAPCLRLRDALFPTLSGRRRDVPPPMDPASSTGKTDVRGTSAAT